MEKILWMPQLITRYEFVVYLDRTFAKEMAQTPLSQERQNRMNQIGSEELKGMGTNWLNPYSFYNNSCLVDQIYIGGNGKWLAATGLDRLADTDKLKPVEYYSHNVDTSREAYILMALLSKWAYLSDALKTS